MCCFSRAVEEVKNTRIFARVGAKGRQVLVYQMALEAKEDLAMVLPISVMKGRVRMGWMVWSNCRGVWRF